MWIFLAFSQCLVKGPYDSRRTIGANYHHLCRPIHQYSNYMSILFALEKHPQEILNKNL